MNCKRLDRISAVLDQSTKPFFTLGERFGGEIVLTVCQKQAAVGNAEREQDCDARGDQLPSRNFSAHDEDQHRKNQRQDLRDQ